MRSMSPSQHSAAVAAATNVNDIFSWTDSILAEKYQFIEEIGYGNWGSVWKCHPKADRDEGSVIAIKLVHRSKNPTSSARVRSLWTEFKCIRALRPHSHPNVIAFSSFVITASYALITMDHHSRLMPVELPEVVAKAYFRQLVDAVGFLHRHGCSHNDIKPANILLSRDDRPILVDFGFAQQYTLTSMDQFSSSLSWGTPEYLSPERARGVLHDERLSDIWALGVTMYEIVVGRTPFEKTEAEEFLTRDALEVYYHRTTTGTFYGDRNISQEFESLIHHMVEPSTTLRIQSCSKALRHRFFDPPLPIRSSTTPEGFSSNATPPRLPPAPSTPASSKRKPTPNKLLRSEERRKDKAIAIYRDEPDVSPTKSRTSPRKPSIPAGVLQERRSFANSPATPSRRKSPEKVKATPSRIPIRKADISSPGPLHHQRIPSIPLATAVPITALTSPPAKKDGVRKHQSSPKSSPVATKAASSVKRSIKPNVVDDEWQEVLAPSTVSDLSPTSPSTSIGSWRSGSAASIAGFTHSATPPQRNSTAPFSSLIPLEMPEESSLPPLGRSSSPFRPSLSLKLRKISLRRAPSALSFRGIKTSISQGVGRRRASTACSGFTMVNHIPEPEDDHNATTMPLSLGSAGSKLDTAGERARLESFSRHIQSIIDAHKPPDDSLSKRFVAPKKDTDAFEVAILSPAEVQEIRKNFAQEAEDQSRKKSISTEGLRARTISFSRRDSSSPAQTTKAVKIRRPSLTPSFVSQPQTRPTSSQEERAPLSSSFSVSSFGSQITNDDEDATATFKPGHRRIPTAIRNTPSIMLTESENEDDIHFDRAETPFDERIASPPPTERMVEEARSLPMWVPDEPEESESDADEGDVDEPTITYSSPSPARLKRKPSRATVHPPSLYSSANTSLQQSVRSARRVVIADLQREPTPARRLEERVVDARADSRASSRMSGHSKKSRIMSFFFHNSQSSLSLNRPTTPSVSSLASTSEISISGSEAGTSKGRGRFKRALKKLF